MIHKTTVRFAFKKTWFPKSRFCIFIAILLYIFQESSVNRTLTNACPTRVAMAPPVGISLTDTGASVHQDTQEESVRATSMNVCPTRASTAPHVTIA